MQRTEIINISGLNDLVDEIFSNSEVQVHEAYSEMEKELISIKNSSEFKQYYQNSIENGNNDLGFAIYYPETNGKVMKSEIKLNPKYCNGKKYRYNIEGWGIIYIHLQILNNETEIECRISVNTKKRAEKWTDTYPKFDLPELWEWKIVEKKARRLITDLKKKRTHNNV